MERKLSRRHITNGTVDITRQRRGKQREWGVHLFRGPDKDAPTCTVHCCTAGGGSNLAPLMPKSLPASKLDPSGKSPALPASARSTTLQLGALTCVQSKRAARWESLLPAVRLVCDPGPHKPGGSLHHANAERVCVRVRARKNERERKGEKERERKRGRRRESARQEKTQGLHLVAPLAAGAQNVRSKGQPPWRPG